jgi:hypothetical protein
MASIHDNGPVSMFPALADDWYQQVQAQRGWKDFQVQDFSRLQREYGVNWLVLQRGSPVLQRGTPVGWDCRYQNHAAVVCRIG